MIRTTLDKSHIKRPIRPLYAMTQATPKSAFLDSAWDRSVDIYPGMVLTRAGGNVVTLPDAAGDIGLGLCALYVGGEGIDEVADSGVNAITVWELGPQAEFEIDAPSFDDAVAWSDPVDGTETLVHFWVSGTDRGKLAPAGASKASHTLSTNPVVRLIEINGDATITVGGLAVRS